MYIPTVAFLLAVCDIVAATPVGDLDASRVAENDLDLFRLDQLARVRRALIIASRVKDHRGRTVHLQPVPERSGPFQVQRRRIGSRAGSVGRRIDTSQPLSAAYSRGEPVTPPGTRFVPSQKQSTPLSNGHNAFYPTGYKLHLGKNVSNQTFFEVRRYEEPQSFRDYTKHTGTLHTARAGRCPRISQNQCGEVPLGVLPESCSNDYQCAGKLRCCYNPCLTVSQCVQPV